MNSKNNGPVLLFKTIVRHWNCFLSSVLMDGSGLKLGKKLGQPFLVSMVETTSSLSFFLARRAKRARHENDHACDWRHEYFLLGLPPSLLAPLDARSRMQSPSPKSEEKEPDCLKSTMVCLQRSPNQLLWLVAPWWNLSDITFVAPDHRGILSIGKGTPVMTSVQKYPKTSTFVT